MQKMQKIGIIGCGFFGISIALELESLKDKDTFKNLEITLFDKNNEYLSEASYVNQCRVHMGYHYPRSPSTVNQTLGNYEQFVSVYNQAIKKPDENFSHYYSIVKGSNITSQEYQKFLDDNNLMASVMINDGPSYSETGLMMRKEFIDGWWSVPECIFDVNKAKKVVNDKLKTTTICTRLNHEITKIDIINGKYVVHCSNGYQETFDYLINATYANVNNINKLLQCNNNFELQDYKYELCEEFIVDIPNAKTEIALAFFDGPFYGIIPWGDKKNRHVIYDVELSRLQVVKGLYPIFQHNIEYYQDESRRNERFNRWKEKAEQFIKNVDDIKYVKSIFTIRVLPLTTIDDERPTYIESPIPNYWFVFSGKISTCVSAAKEIKELLFKSTIRDSMLPWSTPMEHLDDASFRSIPKVPKVSKVLVLGGNGRIGIHHVKWFEKYGYECNIPNRKEWKSYKSTESTEFTEFTEYHGPMLISLCTATEDHLNNIKESLDLSFRSENIKGILCEKSVCKEINDKTSEQYTEVCDLLERSAIDNIYIMSQFRYAIPAYLELSKRCNVDLSDINSFEFRWTTRPGYPEGNSYYYWNLLGFHGISILSRLLNDDKINIKSIFSKEYKDKGYRVEFTILTGTRKRMIKCVFDVSNSVNGKVHRYFGVNGFNVCYSVVEESGHCMSVLKYIDIIDNLDYCIKVRDFMDSYILDFIDACLNRTSAREDVVMSDSKSFSELQTIQRSWELQKLLQELI